LRCLRYVCYLRDLLYVCYLRDLRYVCYLRDLRYVRYLRDLPYACYLRDLHDPTARAMKALDHQDATSPVFSSFNAIARQVPRAGWRQIT